MRTDSGAAATVIEEFEACEEAVSIFLRLYEDPAPVNIGPPERFGPFLEPVETVNSARLFADYGTELEAARQAVDEHWEQWQQDERPAIRRFVGEVERRWLRTYPAIALKDKQFPARREIVRDLLQEGLILFAGKG